MAWIRHLRTRSKGPREDMAIMTAPTPEHAALYHYRGADVPSLVRNWAERRGDKPFMIWEPASGADKTWTYADFWKEICQLGAGLHARGIGVGDNILIHGDNSPEMVIGWYACALVGAVAVTTGTHSTADELAYFIEQAAPRAAITQPRYGAMFTPHAHQIEWLAVTDNDAGAAPNAPMDYPHEPFAALFGDAALAPHRTPDPMLPVGIVYTSGSTSRPKAVQHTHANYLWAARLLPMLFNFGADDVHLAQMPFYHLNAQVWTIAVALGTGGGFVLLPRFTAARYWEVVIKHGVTHSAVIPLIVQGAGPIPPLEKLKLKVFTGSAMYAEEFAKACGARLSGCYGMSELIAPVLTTSIHDRWQPGSLGRPTPGYEIRIADAETGRTELGVGETGELQVRATRGVQIFLGYANNPAANAAAFTEDGWFRTGDIVRLDASGEFFYVDRGAYRLKVGGENVSASEVEEALYSVPGVREAAIVAQPDEALSEVVAAYIVVQDGINQEATRALIDKICAEKLSKFKRPRSIYFLDELPKLAIAGKIDKVLLKKMAAAAIE